MNTHTHLTHRRTAAMLDPSWTPAAGYAHATDLLRLLEEHDRSEARKADRGARTSGRSSS